MEMARSFDDDDDDDDEVLIIFACCIFSYFLGVQDVSSIKWEK